MSRTNWLETEAISQPRRDAGKKSEGKGQMPSLFVNDLKIIIKQADVLQLLKNQPLALLGQATDFLTGQLFQKLSSGLSYPDGDNFCFLFHDPIIDVCSRLSMADSEFIIDICIHMHIIESNNRKPQSPVEPIKSWSPKKNLKKFLTFNSIATTKCEELSWE